MILLVTSRYRHNCVLKGILDMRARYQSHRHTRIDIDTLTWFRTPPTLKQSLEICRHLLAELPQLPVTVPQLACHLY